MGWRELEKKREELHADKETPQEVLDVYDIFFRQPTQIGHDAGSLRPLDISREEDRRTFFSSILRELRRRYNRPSETVSVSYYNAKAILLDEETENEKEKSGRRASLAMAGLLGILGTSMSDLFEEDMVVEIDWPVVNVTFEEPFEVVDIDKGFEGETTKATQEAGEYSLVPIVNPVTREELNSEPWYVISGTNLGLPIDEWEKMIPDFLE